jgi:hypothetical protein
LKTDFQTATETEQLDIAFKYRYLTSVVYEINQGTEVGEAIIANRPEFKPTAHPSGSVVLTGNTPNFEQEVDALIEYAQGLLSE